VGARARVVAAIGAAFAGWALGDLLPHLTEVGVPAGEVRTLDRVYDWEQTRSQGLLLDVDHTTLGSITLPGPPLRFDGDPAVAHRAPPTLGEHDASVRAWLADLDAMQAGEATSEQK
jgi:crotonobetainyl-CoA:carnitine CoA-transferase CaiB-like acyl-CoA transferase